VPARDFLHFWSSLLKVCIISFYEIEECPFDCRRLCGGIHLPILRSPLKIISVSSKRRLSKFLFNNPNGDIRLLSEGGEGVVCIFKSKEEAFFRIFSCGGNPLIEIHCRTTVYWCIVNVCCFVNSKVALLVGFAFPVTVIVGLAFASFFETS